MESMGSNKIRGKLITHQIQLEFRGVIQSRNKSLKETHRITRRNNCTHLQNFQTTWDLFVIIWSAGRKKNEKNTLFLFPNQKFLPIAQLWKWIPDIFHLLMFTRNKCARMKSCSENFCNWFYCMIAFIEWCSKSVLT